MSRQAKSQEPQLRSSRGGAVPRRRRGALFASLAAGLVLATLSTRASADGYPTCDRTPSESDVDAAKGMHKAAEQYYARARYDKAIVSWKEAYGFDCTAHRLLINIGNAHEKLGNTSEAIDAFEAYMDRVGSAADPTIVEKVNNLRALIDRTPDPQPAPDPVPPPPPKPDPDRDATGQGPGAAPWVVVGVGGGVAIVGAVVLGIGIQKENNAEKECPNRGDNEPCEQEFADEGNLGIKMQIGGGVMVGAGLAAAAGGLIWWAVASPGSGGDEAAKSLQLGPVKVTPNIALGPEYSGLGLTGSF